MIIKSSHAQNLTIILLVKCLTIILFVKCLAMMDLTSSLRTINDIDVNDLAYMPFMTTT
jgi:hypothetical protein